MTAWTESRIVAAIARQTLASKCVVLVDRCSWPRYECDVMAVTKDLRIIDVEVKISRADLKVDAAKDKWWRHVVYGQPPIHRDWPPRVWKHYFAVPAEIWRPDLVDCLPSPASGVLLLSEGRNGVQVSCFRRSKPCRDAYRLTPAEALDVARLANLRMWDAYERLDAERRTNARQKERVA